MKVKICEVCPYRNHWREVRDIVGAHAKDYLCITCPCDPLQLRRAVDPSLNRPLTGKLHLIKMRLQARKEEAHEDLAARP